MEYDDILAKISEEIRNFVRKYGIQPTAILINEHVLRVLEVSPNLALSSLPTSVIKQIMGLDSYGTTDPNIFFKVMLTLE